MGFSFHARHTNLVAYATTPAAEAPRVMAKDLWEFLAAISHGKHTGWLFSRNLHWPDELVDAARRAMDMVDRRGTDGRLANADEVADSLAEVRHFLSGYQLYVLVVGYWEAHSAKDFALESGGDALVLIPVHESYDEALDSKDILPAAAVLQDVGRKPGVVLWTADGDARFISMERFDSGFRYELLKAIRQKDRAKISALLSAPNEGHTKTILHLSDLHFGRQDAAINLGMLQTELVRIGGSVNRIAITGDVLDNPREEDLIQFQAFRTMLRSISQEQILIVAGNHDMRFLGNVGRSFEQVARMPLTTLTVDHSMRVVFLGVNSALDGAFAKGRVTQRQMTELGAELNAELAARPEVGSYLRVVLIHHHPFRYAQAPESKGLVSRILGRKEEVFLLLEDAKEFLEWCARLNVSVVLHGHKHIARYFTKGVELRNRRPVPVTAVGCGSSLGAEGSPISYNILRWNDSRRRWDARFFESVGGSLFEPKLITYAREALDSE